MSAAAQVVCVGGCRIEPRAIVIVSIFSQSCLTL
jgi:hypothetical protein